MSKKISIQAPGEWESRAFFAALLAAARGDDQLAGDILRDIADKMSKEFAKKGSVKVVGEGSEG